MIKFTKDHEWIKVEGNTGTIGITEYAAEALGELVYVELPTPDTDYNKGDAFAVVESSKSASDVYIPVTGKVTAVNENLNSEPELVNNSSLENGWIAKIEILDASQLDDMLDKEAYQELLKNI